MLEWAIRKEVQLSIPTYAVAEEEDRIVYNVVSETVDPETKGNAKNKRNPPTKLTEAAPVRKKGTGPDMLLRARGLDSGVFIAEDSVGDPDVNGGHVPGEGSSIPTPPPDPATTALVESSSAESPVAYTTKKSKVKPSNMPISVNKRVSLRARTSASSSSENFHAVSKPSKTATNSTASRNPDGRKTQGVENTDYKMLSRVPGTTEVIFDRYPALRRAAGAKKGKRRRSSGGGKYVRKMPGMDVLVFLCRKASDNGHNRPMKAGAENGVASGSGGLVFLRRNTARVGTRV